MNLSQKNVKLLKWLLWLLFVILLGIALYYATSKDKGTNGVLPGLLGAFIMFVLIRLDNASKKKKEQESKGV